MLPCLALQLLLRLLQLLLLGRQLVPHLLLQLSNHLALRGGREGAEQGGGWGSRGEEQQAWQMAAIGQGKRLDS